MNPRGMIRFELMSICILWILIIDAFQQIHLKTSLSWNGHLSFLSKDFRVAPLHHTAGSKVDGVNDLRQFPSTKLPTFSSLYNSQPYHSYSTALAATLKDSPSSQQKGKIEVAPVTVSIPLGPGYEPMNYQFRPLFRKSKFIVATYPIPFDLNLDKPPKGFPAPVVSKDNAEGDDNKEREGDALRATTSWSQSYLMGNGGWASDIANVAGNIRWKRAVFDTTGAPWDAVIKALQSNAEKSDDITLVFERPLDDEDEPVEKKD